MTFLPLSPEMKPRFCADASFLRSCAVWVYLSSIVPPGWRLCARCRSVDRAWGTASISRRYASLGALVFCYTSGGNVSRGCHISHSTVSSRANHLEPRLRPTPPCHPILSVSTYFSTRREASRVLLDHAARPPKLCPCASSGIRAAQECPRQASAASNPEPSQSCPPHSCSRLGTRRFRGKNGCMTFLTSRRCHALRWPRNPSPTDPSPL